MDLYLYNNNNEITCYNLIVYSAILDIINFLVHPVAEKGAFFIVSFRVIKS